MVFVDDFTKYFWLFPLHSKADVFNVFLTFKLQVENLPSLKIKVFRSDGGGEFMSSKFQELLRTSELFISVLAPTHLSL